MALSCGLPFVTLLSSMVAGIGIILVIDVQNTATLECWFQFMGGGKKAYLGLQYSENTFTE